MSSRSLLLLSLAIVAGLSWGAREASHMRINRLGGPTASNASSSDWFSAEPDGLYHARRVERSLRDGLPVASFDPAMNAPNGAAIPWPNYYDSALRLVLKPFAPSEPQQLKRYVEQSTATIPLWLGVLTSLVLTLGATTLAGWRAGLITGSLHALASGSIHYSAPGVADHHAFVALLVAAMLVIISKLNMLNQNGDSYHSQLLGVTGGILAGLLLGTWTAALIPVAIVQLYYFVQVLIYPQQRNKIALSGACFHLAAVVALMPAVAASPWQELQPWVVVNLSWFHPLWLALGATYFAAIYFSKQAKTAARTYALILFTGGCLLFILRITPFNGIREGFEWAARANSFMADIAESQAVWHAGASGIFNWLGITILLLPLAAYKLLTGSKHRNAYLLWTLAATIFIVQALTQLRFSDLASIPIALLVGCWLGPLLKEKINSCTPRIVTGIIVVLLLQAPSILAISDRLQHRIEDQGSIEVWRQNGVRSMHEWLSANAAPQSTVLAHWDQGHALEFVANCKSVATNFGLYVGEQSFRAPADFFTASNWQEGGQILNQHQCDYVLVHSALPSAWPQLMSVTETSTASWSSSLAAALFHAGGPVAAPNLRLVFVSPIPDPQPDPRLAAPGEVAPVGMLWQHVPGAKLQIKAEPFSEVQIEMRIGFTTSAYAFLYQVSATANANGIAEMTIPYSAGSKNCSAPSATLIRGKQKVNIKIAESAVLNGEVLTLP